MFRRPRLPPCALSAGAGPPGDSSRATRVQHRALVGQHVQPRGEPRASDGQRVHRCGRAAARGPARRVHRRGRRRSAGGPSRRRALASGRPFASHGSRLRDWQRETVPATGRANRVGRTGSRRRTCPRGFRHLSHRGRKGIRLGTHAASRGRVRHPVGALWLLRPRAAAIPVGGCGRAAHARGPRDAGQRRHESERGHDGHPDALCRARGSAAAIAPGVLDRNGLDAAAGDCRRRSSPRGARRGVGRCQTRIRRARS